jgi:putative spermidine/putrescine transport system substrate-binding protein
MSRSPRRLVAGAVLATIALAATACASSATGAAGGATTVTFQGFAGVFQDAFTKAVIDPFQAKHPDIRINYQPVKNSAQVLAGLRSARSRPTVDIAIIDSSVAPTANKEGLFAKLDKDSVPNLADLDPAAVDPDGYGPGLTFDSLSIIYNTKQVATPPKSWEDLWKPEFNGKLVLPIADTSGIALIRVLDEIAGADYQKTIDPAIDRLKQLALPCRPGTRSRTSTPPSPPAPRRSGSAGTRGGSCSTTPPAATCRRCCRPRAPCPR